MMLTQFQDEPAPVATGAERLADESMNAAHGAELSALALGLSLRNHLTDGEKDYLDRLAPPGGLTFMVRDDSYVHPDGVELFPLEVIEAAVNLGGQAIFSHHYRPAEGDGNTFEIHTAVVRQDESGVVVLGMFRPENILGQDGLRNEFADLTLRFRRAIDAVVPLSRRLAEVLENDAPAIVVNRLSGRVLAVNNTAGKFLKCEASAIVGLEMTEWRKMVSGVVAFRHTDMRNISQADLELSVMTFPKSGRYEPVPAPESAVSVDETRSGLNRIIRAATEPANDNHDNTVRQPVELFGEITRQAGIAVGSLSSSPRAKSHPVDQYESADFEYERL